MDGDEPNAKVETQTGVGPEVATRRLAVSLGRKVLGDIVLGFSALTVISVLKILQTYSDSVVLYGFEMLTTAWLSIWLCALLLSVIPNDVYERVATIENFSFEQIAVGIGGFIIWWAIFLFVSRFISTTVAGLGVVAGV